MNWIDIGIIIILVVHALNGLNKGFIISLFGVASIFIAAYISKLYYPYLISYIYANTTVYQNIEKFISKRVFNIISKTGESQIQNADSILEGFKLPEVIKEKLIDGIKFQPQTGDFIQSTGNLISGKITDIFITIISVVLVFIAARILLYIIVEIIDRIMQLPVLKTVNRLAGLGFGILKGVMIIFVIFTILTPIISISPDGFIANGTTKSKIGYYFYTHNIIINYISGTGFTI